MTRGFTLVELLVAIAIFGLLTAAVTANLRGSGPSRQLQEQSGNVVSLLRQAQVQAIAGQPFNGTVPVGGYGVHVAVCAAPPCEVSLFVDSNANFAMGASEVIETITLGSEVTIKAVSARASSMLFLRLPGKGGLYFNFRPPAGGVCFDKNCSDGGTATITLGAHGTELERVISINQISGQISF
ncbi:MAG: prepilin-type N-terminal cleavage/methylation domain-containing protein [Parcubacteria group bacterium]|nr:prepilin-type N-terminal cleavage/methylation domain-containing protein [Parcubacteria group bacterium]